MSDSTPQQPYHQSMAGGEEHPDSLPGLDRFSIELLVFDLDGTLIDSSADLCNSVNSALLHVGQSALPPEQITSYIGDGAATLIRRALMANTCEDKREHSIFEITLATALDFFLRYYREHQLDQTRPYPGVLETLRDIRERRPSLPMAILTNKPVGLSREICSALGLAPFFFAIYGGDSFPKKPNPLGLQAVIQQASVIRLRDQRQKAIVSSAVVMVGDSHVDMETARRCGVRTLGCTYGLSPDSLLLARPDMLAANPMNWISALQI